MSNILVLAGSKQSGKSSSAKFLYGHIMKKYGAIRYFDITEDGKLLVNSYYDNNGDIQEEQGELDIERKDYDFYMYAEETIWPHIKLYNFGDNLKNAASNIFGIEPELLWGSNDDKNTPINIKWSDVAFALLPKEIEDLKKHGKFYNQMTVREFLQVFGTKVCRRIQDTCWIERLIEKMVKEQSELVVIADCRFVNEVETMKKVGAKVIKLTRKIDNDNSESEVDLDNYKNFDAVIDNKNMTIHEKNINLFNILKQWGWVEGEI